MVWTNWIHYNFPNIVHWNVLRNFLKITTLDFHFEKNHFSSILTQVARNIKFVMASIKCTKYNYTEESANSSGHKRTVCMLKSERHKLSEPREMT